MLTLIKTAAGFGIYIGLILLIDKEARKLLKLIIAEIKGSINMFILKRNKTKQNSSQNNTLDAKN
jgi:hypothetical protein